LPVLEEDDVVGLLHGAQPMGDQQHGALLLLPHLSQSLEDLRYTPAHRHTHIHTHTAAHRIRVSLGPHCSPSLLRHNLLVSLEKQAPAKRAPAASSVIWLQPPLPTPTHTHTLTHIQCEC